LRKFFYSWYWLEMIEPGCVRPAAFKIEGIVPLEVFLNGTRNYVQGSQILARTAELIRPGFGPLNLTEFVFKRTSINLIGVRLDDSASNEPQRGASPIGDALFQSDQMAIHATFVELSAAAPKADLPETVALKLKSGGTGGNGCFAFHGAFSFEDALRTVVQAVKKLHETLTQDARDIWLTGMRAAAIPIDKGFRDANGQIEVELVRLMQSPPQYQTLNKVTITGGKSGLAPFFVTFALRSDRGVNVH
jgi:hypothetical protein